MAQWVGSSGWNVRNVVSFGISFVICKNFIRSSRMPIIVPSIFELHITLCNSACTCTHNSG